MKIFARIRNPGNNSIKGTKLRSHSPVGVTQLNQIKQQRELVSYVYGVMVPILKDLDVGARYDIREGFKKSENAQFKALSSKSKVSYFL